MGVAAAGEAALEIERKRADELRLHLDAAIETRVAKEIELGALQNRLCGARLEAERGALDIRRVCDEEWARSELAIGLRCADARREAAELSELVAELRDQSRAESDNLRVANKNEEEARYELRRRTEHFHDELVTAANSGPFQDFAARQLAESLKKSNEEEKRLTDECRRQAAHLRVLQKRVAWSSGLALSWVPDGCSINLRSELSSAAVEQASGASQPDLPDPEIQRLRDELEIATQAWKKIQQEQAMSTGNISCIAAPESVSSLTAKVHSLEESMAEVECSRSAIQIRATVAEEQVLQLERHVKEMAEGYQIQILKLKLKLESLGFDPNRIQ